MKNVLPLLFAFFATIVSLHAQCVMDSTIFGTQIIVSPYPSTPSNPASTLKPACAGQPYTQTITFNIPDTISLPNFGGLAVALNSVSVATTGAIIGLPTGISYSCNPPNCVFPKNTLGCLLLSGTTTEPPGNDTLSINLSISSPLFPFPIALNFPEQLNDTLVYFIVVKPAGQCNSSSIDLASPIRSLKNVPNPFAQKTAIVIETQEDGIYRLDVFDMFGRVVNTQKINLIEGRNEYIFDAQDLPNGSYFYTIGNGQGRAGDRFVIAR